jgi:nucleolar MIF4G domain-containing protein 1
MFGTLIVEGGLGLDVLKKLNLTYLQPKTKSFLEVMMITIFLQSQTNPRTGRDEEAVVRIFTKVRDVPQLIKGLQYFLQKFVVKTDVAGGKEDKATVNWACKAARDALEALVANESVEE